MVFQEEIKTLSNVLNILLQKIESETDYIKNYIEEECEKIQKEGWSKQDSKEPWIKIFNKEKYTLKIAFIHARKGEHITGADLAFELKNKKVVFIQSKRVDLNGRINFNRFQLQKLIELELQICGLFPFYSPLEIHEWIHTVHDLYHRFEEYYVNKFVLFNPVFHWLLLCHCPFRATFYHLILKNQQQVEQRFFHTSEISFILAGRKSVSQKEFLNQGLLPYEFREKFWECKIGGPDIGEDIKKEMLNFYSLLTNRLIIWIEIEEK